jgi:tRNA A-37 threonylcarbamoyl transferase component Bud32
MSDLSGLDASQRLALARAQLLRGWHAGTCPSVEQVLCEHPGLSDDAGAVADLVHVEAVLRQARGESLALDTLGQRFPPHADAIRRRLVIDPILRGPEQAALPPAPVPEGETPAPPAGGASNSTAGILEALPADEDYPRVPGYEVLAELGRGGMGVVYRARHLKLRREVALKMILAGAAGEMDRFRLEAEALASLQHPGIVQIHEIGEVDLGSGAPCPYFSLELCPGGSLAGKLGPYREPRQAALLVRRLARAMHAAHRKGIIHRDLKPGNVLLAEDGSPKITDFGLARMASAGGESSGKTRTGAVMGTPSYMAPEQAAGKVHDLGPACDIYALGAILYECLTGRPPFQGPTMLDTLMMVIEQDLIVPRQINANVPRDLETICVKCLQKDARNRYATAAELADDLERYLDDEPIRARPPGLLEGINRWLRKHQGLAIAYVVAVIPGLLALVLGWIPSLVPSLETLLATLVVLPVFAVLVRLVLLADMRWTLAALLPLGALGTLLVWQLPLRNDPVFALLLVGSPLGLLAFVVGFVWARGWWDCLVLLLCYALSVLPTVFAVILLVALRIAGVVREFSLGEFAGALPMGWLRIAGLAFLLGLCARFVAWALRRESGGVFLGALVGAVAGVVLVEWKGEPIAAYLSFRGEGEWTSGAITLYFEIGLGYLGAVVAGLLSPAHRPAGDQVEPSLNSTRSRSTSIRAVEAGKATGG